MYFSGLNAAGEQAPVRPASVPVSTWQGPVEVTESPRIPVSAFAEQLLAEPEAESTGEPSCNIRLYLFQVLVHDHNAVLCALPADSSALSCDLKCFRCLKLVKRTLPRSLQTLRQLTPTGCAMTGSVRIVACSITIMFLHTNPS